MSHAQGGFQGAGGLEFWMKTDGGRPQITINIGGGSVRGAPNAPAANGRAGLGNCWAGPAHAA